MSNTTVRQTDPKVPTGGSLQFIKKNKNIATAIKSWPLPVRLLHHTTNDVNTKNDECYQQVTTVAFCRQHGTDNGRTDVGDQHLNAGQP